MSATAESYICCLGCEGVIRVLDDSPCPKCQRCGLCGKKLNRVKAKVEVTQGTELKRRPFFVPDHDTLDSIRCGCADGMSAAEMVQQFRKLLIPTDQLDRERKRMEIRKEFQFRHRISNLIWVAGLVLVSYFLPPFDQLTHWQILALFAGGVAYLLLGLNVTDHCFRMLENRRLKNLNV